MTSSFWQREKPRILGAAIVAVLFLLLLAVIWRQQGEIERLNEKTETIERIIDENNQLKAKVVELMDNCGDQ